MQGAPKTTLIRSNSQPSLSKARDRSQTTLYQETDENQENIQFPDVKQEGDGYLGTKRETYGILNVDDSLPFWFLVMHGDKQGNVNK